MFGFSYAFLFLVRPCAYSLVRLVGWFVGFSVACLVGRLDRWLVSLVVFCLFCFYGVLVLCVCVSFCSFACVFVYWLVGWLVVFVVFLRVDNGLACLC